MNVVIEDENARMKKLRIFYFSIIAICIIAVLTTIIIKFNDNGGKVVIKKQELSDDAISEYKQQFYELFENKVNYLKNNEYKINKVDNNQEIVYLGYKCSEKKINDYELNVNIPYINIKDKIIEEYNNEIKNTFEQKAKSVLNSKNNNVIYNVDYSAIVSNNILSVVIRATLKEGGNAQRDIIQTYNYDLANHEKCTIDKMLKIKNIDKKDAGQIIKGEIQKVQDRIDELSALGYSVYKRDYTSDIYNINNVTEFFLGEDNVLYIIYAYGNISLTSEMDIVVM